MKVLASIYRIPKDIPWATGDTFVLVGSTITLMVSTIESGKLPDPQKVEVALDSLTPHDEEGAVSIFEGVILKSPAHPEWEEKVCHGWFESVTDFGVIGIGSNEEEEQRKEDVRRVA